MQRVIYPQYQQLLQQHQLANFEQLWHYQGDWFEPPNRERGGWSGVNFIELIDNSGKQHGFYLKRQQAHMRRTWHHPIVGEPTFVREFKILDYLKNSGVYTPAIAFYASQQDKAIILTAALTGFVSAEEWLKNHALITFKQKKRLVMALAIAVKKLHQTSVVHRSLYLKHLFVKECGDNFEVAIIDFEKSRISMLVALLRLSDLITLCSRTPQINKRLKLAFFKQYFDISHLSQPYKILCSYVYRQSKPKHKLS